jgi:hypothetical protein
MDIVFTEQFTAAADGGIQCEIKVDGKPVACTFSLGALEDVNPDTADMSPEDQFQMNMERLHAIAQEKIFKGKIENGTLRVTGEDV